MKTRAAKRGKSRKSRTIRRRGPELRARGVGLLASIPYAGTIKTEFEKGLGRPLPYINTEHAGLGYDSKSLADALAALNKDSQVGIIVTMGGLVTFNEAVKNAETYFISIVGSRKSLPSVNTGYFLGGLSLESYSRHPLRIADVKKKFSIEDDHEFCLFCNRNSSMNPEEKAVWINKRIVEAAVGKDTANLPNVFNGMFGKVENYNNPTVKAVVVSADPWFFVKGAELVEAANAWIGRAPKGENRIVCYPLQEYSAYQPTGKYMLHGPNLAKAYRDLGQKARERLSSPIDIPGSVDDAPEEVN